MAITIPTSAQIIVPGKVALIKGWIPEDFATRYALAIVDETFNRWVGQLKFGKRGRFFDKGHTMSRFGDSGVTYSFKGKPKLMYPMTETLSLLQKGIAHTLGWHPNCCVINSYAPDSSLYPHRDGQYIPQLGANPVIVAVSFGATRTFSLHPWDHAKGKRNINGVINLKLGHGDMVIMHGSCDTDFQHSIPEEPEVVGQRISLTFRKHIEV